MMCYTFNIMIPNKMYLGKQHFLFQSPTPQTFQFFLGRTAEQKGKKERGLGKGIFALLRLRIERFRFLLIKRKPKQKIFQILLKEKNGGRKKLKKCIEKISVLVRRSGAEAGGNANRKLLVGITARVARVSRRDFVRNGFGLYPIDTASE